jgi:hypothetical protein
MQAIYSYVEDILANATRHSAQDLPMPDELTTG